jgi:hypothetical protein
MSSGKHKFRGTEMCRAIKATEKAGLKVGRIDITPEGFSIVPGAPEEGEPATNDNELDAWIAKNARSVEGH